MGLRLEEARKLQSKEETQTYSRAPKSQRSSTLLSPLAPKLTPLSTVSRLFLGTGRLRRCWSRGHLLLRGFDLQRQTRRDHRDHSPGEKSELVVAHPGSKSAGT